MKITLLYAGILGVFYTFLTFNVIRNRTKEKRSLGHDNDQNSGLFRAIRVHANFGEFVPFILLLMSMDELTFSPAWFLHTVGLVLVTARILHAWGITASSKENWQRLFGMILTFTPMIILSIKLIYKGVA